LGTVRLTDKEIQEWREKGFKGTMTLIEGSRNDWQFIGWNFEKPIGVG